MSQIKGGAPSTRALPDLPVHPLQPSERELVQKKYPMTYLRPHDWNEKMHGKPFVPFGKTAETQTMDVVTDHSEKRIGLLDL
jgi:hypothetical protein